MTGDASHKSGPTLQYLFPSSKAGLLAGLGVVACALLVTAAHTGNVWPVGPTATYLVLLTLAAVAPKTPPAKYSRLRAPVNQRRSGRIYMSGLSIGLTCITITLNTGQLWWSLGAGLAFSVGSVTWLAVITLGSNLGRKARGPQR